MLPGLHRYQLGYHERRNSLAGSQVHSAPGCGRKEHDQQLTLSSDSNLTRCLPSPQFASPRGAWATSAVFPLSKVVTVVSAAGSSEDEPPAARVPHAVSGRAET